MKLVRVNVLLGGGLVQVNSIFNLFNTLLDLAFLSDSNLVKIVSSTGPMSVVKVYTFNWLCQTLFNLLHREVMILTVLIHFYSLLIYVSGNCVTEIILGRHKPRFFMIL